MIGALIVRWQARRGCRYLNTREIDKFIAQWHQDAVFIYPGYTSVSGAHRGRDAIRKWWTTFCRQFPTSHFTINDIYVKSIFSFLPSNKIVLEWEVEGTSKSGQVHRNRGVSVVSIRLGKIVSFEDYFHDYRSQEAAWSSNKAL